MKTGLRLYLHSSPGGDAGSHTTAQRDQLRRRLKSEALATNSPWLYRLLNDAASIETILARLLTRRHNRRRSRRGICVDCPMHGGHLQTDTVSRDIRPHHPPPEHQGADLPLAALKINMQDGRAGGGPVFAPVPLRPQPWLSPSGSTSKHAANTSM